jgi:uncharacterized protein
MKILAFGDIHSDKRKARELASLAKKEGVELVVLTGDITYSENQIEGIIGPFAKEGIKVLMVHGNHEGPATLKVLEELYDNAKSIDGHYHIHDYVGFFGAGGVECGPVLTPEVEIDRMLHRAHDSLISKGKNLRKKVLVTHNHPAGSNSEFSGFAGSPSIRRAIKKFEPDLALFSHIHEASGMEDKMGKSRLVNVARKGIIFDI